MTTLLLIALGTSWGSDLSLWLDDEPLAPEYPALSEDERPPLCVHDKIEEPVQLPDLPHLYSRWDPARSWGTSYTVNALVAAAERVQLNKPEADPVIIGDLSIETGGSLEGHLTHRSGRDADVSLYHGDAEQSAFEDVPPSCLDEETTWLLIDSLLETGRVDYILLDPGLIRRLKAWTLEEGVLTTDEVDAVFPDPATPRMWELTGIVRPAAHHRNHLHVRFLCARFPGDHA